MDTVYTLIHQEICGADPPIGRAQRSQNKGWQELFSQLELLTLLKNSRFSFL